MHASEKHSTNKTTRIVVKILDSAYAKEYLKQVTENVTQLKPEQRTQLLSLLKYFKDLFGSTILIWDTKLIDLDLKPDYKPVNCKYYPVSRINKENFEKILNTYWK